MHLQWLLKGNRVCLLDCRAIYGIKSCPERSNRGFGGYFNGDFIIGVAWVDFKENTAIEYFDPAL